jgi:hypothetical protein
MATNEHGTSDSSDQMDLDRLIGELETEAARRRADPGYPHDADARLHFELARRAPNPPGATSMTEVIAQIQEFASVDANAPAWAGDGDRGHRRRDRQASEQHLARLGDRITALGSATAAGLRSVAARLDQLEPPGDGAAVSSVPREDSDVLTRWRTRLAETLSSGERVLYAEMQADDVVAELRASGVDAYGITSTEPRHRPGPDVRSGDLLAHLTAVADGALGAVVLVGGPDAMSPAAIGPLVAALGRVARSVVVISEAPWWWRLRLGAVNADLAAGRPLDPDTWLHAFHGVAMTGTAEYDATGQSYRVVVRAQE